MGSHVFLRGHFSRAFASVQFSPYKRVHPHHTLHARDFCSALLGCFAGVTVITFSHSPDGSNATIIARGHSKWLPGWIQCHDPRQGLLKVALRMDPTPRSSTGATQSGSPDGSNATILDRGHSKWLSGWIQRHDPLQGPLKVALRMNPTPRSSTGATQSGSPDGSNVMILDAGHSKWLSGWIQCYDPRQGPLKVALRMDPMARSSTVATQSGSPDGSNGTILDRGHSK